MVVFGWWKYIIPPFFIYFKCFQIGRKVTEEESALSVRPIIEKSTYKKRGSENWFLYNFLWPCTCSEIFAYLQGKRALLKRLLLICLGFKVTSFLSSILLADLVGLSDFGKSLVSTFLTSVKLGPLLYCGLWIQCPFWVHLSWCFWNHLFQQFPWLSTFLTCQFDLPYIHSKKIQLLRSPQGC